MSAQPPFERTRLWEPITEAAADRQFVLQKCERCGCVQYPPREVCRQCLSERLSWEPVESTGRILAQGAIHASMEVYFNERRPWRMASVKLDCGPVVIAHLERGDFAVGEAVELHNMKDAAGVGVFVARRVQHAGHDR